MITRVDINDRVREWGLRDDIIEKDYVLGWLLFGISQNKELSDTWIFKGGTCLKKCYFETYRFSEDIDYTVIGDSISQETELKTIFSEIADWIYEQSGVEIIVNEATFNYYETKRGKPALQMKMPYVGPRQMKRNHPKVKFDITTDEIIVQKPETQTILHEYPDIPEGKLTATAYSYSEVFAEKIRALAQRLRPRDLYDVIHIFRNNEDLPPAENIMDILRQKCQYAGIVVPDYASLEISSFRAELEAEWKNMLEHQLPNLPPIESFWVELPALFDWLHKKIVVKKLPIAKPRSKTETPVIFPRSVTLWRKTIPLEEIRFAGRNHLLIKMRYRKANGAIKDYVLAPYSFKKTKEGNLILYAIKRAETKIQAYRVDRIINIEITDTAFSPRYRIEF